MGSAGDGCRPDGLGFVQGALHLKTSGGTAGLQLEIRTLAPFHCAGVDVKF